MTICRNSNPNFIWGQYNYKIQSSIYDFHSRVSTLSLILINNDKNIQTHCQASPRGQHNITMHWMAVTNYLLLYITYIILKVNCELLVISFFTHPSLWSLFRAILNVTKFMTIISYLHVMTTPWYMIYVLHTYVVMFRLCCAMAFCQRKNAL